MLYEYYRQIAGNIHYVSVVQDQTTGVSSLRIVSFSPEDSRAIAAALLRLGEEIVIA